jgi:hypothetical protein
LNIFVDVGHQLTNIFGHKFWKSFLLYLFDICGNVCQRALSIFLLVKLTYFSNDFPYVIVILSVIQKQVYVRILDYQDLSRVPHIVQSLSSVMPDDVAIMS